MTYNELLIKLRGNHLYANIRTRIKKTEEIIEGLELPVSPLLKEDKLSRVREIIGEGFKADYLSTNESILITKK